MISQNQLRRKRDDPHGKKELKSLVRWGLSHPHGKVLMGRSISYSGPQGDCGKLGNKGAAEEGVL